MLFWAAYEHLGKLSPRFVSGKAAKRFARKFKRTIHVVDSTTIQLIASCMDWAKHRRRKAAAKCHLRLDLQSFLPRFAIIDTAREADAKRARELCAGIKEGEIVIFDKAYVDFAHLWNLEERGVFWVTRAKENLQFEVVETYPVKKDGKIVSDELVGLKNASSQKLYPELMRRIVAWVEVDGKERLMTFLTNQLTWSPESVAELYRCRWRIEVFFKQIKQTLQLADFLGTSANAVRWQVWTALLVYLPKPVQFLRKTGGSRSDVASCGMPVEWRGTNVDMSEWPQGPAKLGFGDDDVVTWVNWLNPANGEVYPTYYFRRAFTVPSPS